MTKHVFRRNAMLPAESKSSYRRWPVMALVIAGASWLHSVAIHAQDAVNDSVRPESKVNQLLKALDDQFAQVRFGEGWARGLREIVEVGPDAVPDLIAELDATDSDIMLRNLGFMLRAIGDKRAMPGLIRALPKTLRKPGSDMGLRVDDQELLAFMQKHDLDSTDRGNMYSFGRPVREIGRALEALSGVKHGEEELYGVMLRGGLLQQHFQRQLYRKCAERWRAWWEKHWQAHGNDRREWMGVVTQ